jgi:protein-S-isoprenylcysteine O-methyltransferase Ste14
MKSVFQFFISTIALLFGLGFISNPSVIFHYQIWITVLASVVMFATQPKMSKDDIVNKSDGYSMLGIMVMAIAVTNMTVYDFGRGGLQTNHAMNYVGLVMIWTGMAFRVYAIQTLGNYFSNAAQIKDEHQLCEEGIYRIIRHPSYTGAIASIVGTVLWLGAWQTLPISLYLIFVAYYHRITQEEKILTLHFGEKYVQYCKRTGALLPKIRLNFLPKIKFIEKK